MPKRKTLGDYLGGGMGTARDVKALHGKLDRQNNTRGMGLARDVRAGQAEGWTGRGKKRRMGPRKTY